MFILKKTFFTYIICILTVFGLVFSAFLFRKDEPKERLVINPEEMKGVWLSYSEFAELIKDCDLETYRKRCNDTLQKIRDKGLNTVILHLRANCDSFYFSTLFPWTNRVKKPDFDPLKEFLAVSKEKGIAVHGWINPFRGFEGMEKSDYFKNLERGSIININNGCYLNPAKAGVRKLVIEGVREIIENYDLDGIHIDDYFYPTTDETFDFSDYEKYKSETENPVDLGEFRRNAVNMTVLGIYQAVKAYKNGQLQFGISPCADMDKNHDTYYADVYSWLKGGFCDYICPQIYFGFNYPVEQFKFGNMCKKWSENCSDKVKLYIGLAPYKQGKEDAGSKEWIEDKNIIPKQIEFLKSFDNCRGYILFSYGYI